eukprot:TRINITY_DN3060_c0_g3_i3.p1 TRINITY_DN3060_c0_g3~~TRINITY_DN3060_c0_g3_i3.p1  ORF type:complete len:372 (-),score=92.22 TRINITY_DN3060_c0_g3_i3:971-2086(-)
MCRNSHRTRGVSRPKPPRMSTDNSPPPTTPGAMGAVPSLREDGRPVRDYYELLGVSPNAPKELIAARCAKMKAKYNGEACIGMQSVNDPVEVRKEGALRRAVCRQILMVVDRAFETLRHSDTREEYDNQLRRPAVRSPRILEAGPDQHLLDWERCMLLLHSCPDIQIPDTVLFKNGQPDVWLFSSQKFGCVCRKHKYKTVLPSVYDKFANSEHEIKAVAFMWERGDDRVPQRKELDQKALTDLCKDSYEGSRKHIVALQQYVPHTSIVTHRVAVAVGTQIRSHTAYSSFALGGLQGLQEASVHEKRVRASQEVDTREQGSSIMEHMVKALAPKSVLQVQASFFHDSKSSSITLRCTLALATPSSPPSATSW